LWKKTEKQGSISASNWVKANKSLSKKVSLNL